MPTDPVATAAALMCANEDHRPKRAVFRVTWPDGRFRPTTACLSCARLVVVPEAYDERQSVLLEVIDGDYTAAESTPDWHAAYRQVAASFAAETLTTSYLVGLLREAQTPCQRCGSRTGTAVLVIGDERTFVCDICVARTPAFTERLATRMREDKPLLDRLADDRPIRVKDTSKYPPRERT